MITIVKYYPKSIIFHDISKSVSLFILESVKIITLSSVNETVVIL